MTRERCGIVSVVSGKSEFKRTNRVTRELTSEKYVNKAWRGLFARRRRGYDNRQLGSHRNRVRATKYEKDIKKVAKKNDRKFVRGTGGSYRVSWMSNPCSFHCFPQLFSASPSLQTDLFPFSPLTRCRSLTTTPLRIYGTHGGRYVLWLIVLLSLTYFQFTAAAGHFASRLSIVCDERHFMRRPTCLAIYASPPVVGSRAELRLAYFYFRRLAATPIRR